MKPCIILNLSFLPITSAFFFLDGTRTKLKTDLLNLATETQRGINATPSQTDQIRSLFEQLERINPTKNPLQSSKVNGDWSLDYSTSDSIIGKGGLPRVGPIVQNIDTNLLSAENREVVSFYGLEVPRKITAKLSPRNTQLTDVKFERFSIGPVGFNAPDSFRGFLDVTYLDDEVRLTRGDKGNLFVLTRLD